MTTIEFITILFCRVDDAMVGVPKHSQSKLWPSEIVTLGLLFALKGVGERPFYRWLSRDYRPLFPKLPERTRLFRLLTVHRDWTARFLAAPSLLGVADTYGVELSPKPLEPTGREVGVDVGVHHLVATSDGTTKDNPQWYRAEQAELRVLQRRVSRRQLGGSNRHKAVAALQRQHERIANRRKDYLNKLAHELVTVYDKIALEDLLIVNMAHNRHLSKSILDAGWGYLKLHLAHKAAEAGRVVYRVDPAHTSKTCSQCGGVFETLTLSDRWVSCSCGLSLDRDVNAARNILKRAGHARWGLTYPAGESVLQEAPAL